MKIISWNVNGIRAVDRKGVLRELIDERKPDILLLQEVKATPEQFAKEMAKYSEYHAIWSSAKKAGYAGVSAWIRSDFLASEKISAEKNFPGNPFSDEGRVMRLDFEKNGKNFSVLGVYFPNGGKSEEAWQGKLLFYDAFLEYVNELKNRGKEVIWGGDVNCAHREIDLARPKENDGLIGFHPLERVWMDRVIEAGWIDIFREKNPQKTDVYSWWHVITRARDRNIGWRIDYLFLSKTSVKSAKNVQYLTSQTGSDHCPVMLEMTV